MRQACIAQRQECAEWREETVTQSKATSSGKATSKPRVMAKSTSEILCSMGLQGTNGAVSML